MALTRLTNTVIFLFTLICFILCFQKDGEWKLSHGLHSLRYFTILSNLLSGFAALLVAVNLTEQGLPFGVWLFKYIATAAVTVTFITVMVFLGPTLGYKKQLEKKGFFFHLAGPLLAILSFCFMERFHELSFSLSLTGMLPVIVYGLLYAWKVLFCPEEKRWDDFYGYNKGGHWLLSSCAMLVGTFLVCILLRFLYRL
jgi:hypothetical protein